MLIKKRSKIIIAIIGVLLLVVMAAVGVYLVKSGRLQIGKKEKVELPAPAKSMTLGEVLTNIKEPQVIAYDDRVEIDYSPKYNNFLVTIKKASNLEQYREYKKHAENYFKAMKGDVCQLKIAYAPPQNLKGQIGAADAVPYGCP